jgi:RNA polymerase sigma factor (sigma-70 family)
VNEPEEWSKFRQGDAEAFNRIYRHFAQVLYGYGSKFCKRSEVIEDCIQDLFVELWESRERLSATTSIKFYLFRCLRRKIAKLPSLCLNISEDSHPLSSSLISESYEFSLIIEQQDEARKQLLEQALNDLSVRQREILYLKYFDGLSFPQIAEVMQIDLNSTYKLTYKALAAIKQNLSRHTALILTLLSTVAAALALPL